MKLLLKRYFRPKRHRRRRWLPVSVLRRMLGDRVRSWGVDRPTEPDYSDEPTQTLFVQPVAMSTPAVIEPHETGIGIIKPVVDGEWCDSAHKCDGDEFAYECELNADHDGEHSALDGHVTWKRETALVVMS